MGPFKAESAAGAQARASAAWSTGHTCADDTLASCCVYVTKGRGSLQCAHLEALLVMPASQVCQYLALP
jgi:hypothetical protein